MRNYYTNVLNMELKIYNSKTHKKETFIPLSEKSIKMYVCGPTVYNEIHIGNGRSAIVFDVLFRILKYMYKEVVYTRNITDIDDKIINKAIQEGKTCQEISKFWEKSYFDNCKKLNLLTPTHNPRATETIPDIIKFIADLLDNDFAYEKEGSVFFKVSALENYGCLSNNKSNLIEGQRISLNDDKEHQHDFVLWKPSKEVYEPYWNSPWGKGRPGWHIECSAMSYKFLGEKFDIHAGGSDLLFPHHENENAQNIGLSGENAGPRYWMHNAMLLLEGEKMSKSIGNIILLSEALKDYDPIFLKFYMLNTHYRHMLVWSEENIKILAVKFNNWIMHLGLYFETSYNDFNEEDLGELLNDLNTPGFFSFFENRLSKAINEKNEDELRKLAGLLTLLGLNVNISNISEEIKNLAELRFEKKENKAFQESDILRKEIEAKGFYVLDKENGYELKPKFNSIISE